MITRSFNPLPSALPHHIHGDPANPDNAFHMDTEGGMSALKTEADPPSLETHSIMLQSARSSGYSPGDCPADESLGPPRISFDPWTKKYSIIVCTLGLLFFDLALPCLVYYALSSLTNINIEINLGISCASLGLGELVELPLRGYRLYKHPSKYAPLGQTTKWGFDFLFWWYLVATVIGIVPYVMSTSLDEPILWLFLMTPGFLVGFLILTAAVSAVPFRLPFRVSSDDKGQRCKPFVYYVVEDFVAVDAGQMREYREEFRLRWIASPVFRRLLWDINAWWILGGFVFIGALSGMTWGLEFNVAYGLSFGILFVWMGLWALGSLLIVRRALRVEHEWFKRNAAGVIGKSVNLGKHQDMA